MEVRETKNTDVREVLATSLTVVDKTAIRRGENKFLAV
jgi:hypothetical protein